MTLKNPLILLLSIKFYFPLFRPVFWLINQLDARRADKEDAKNSIRSIYTETV